MKQLFYKFCCTQKRLFSLKPAEMLSILFLFSILFLTSKTAYSQIGPGKALVLPPTGNFAIDGNLQANVPSPTGIGDWVPGVAAGFVLNTGRCL